MKVLSQFRQIIITSPAKLSLKNDSLAIKTVDADQEQALNQLSTLLVDTDQCIITAPLLAALNSNHVNLVITNRHHLPTLNSNRLKISQQFGWNNDNKSTVWQAIIREKLKMQAKLLSYLKLKSFTIPKSTITDPIEAQAAKMYFNQLFGNSFARDFDNNESINAQLNYGYAIAVNFIATQIYSHGYLPEIGIHHHSVNNQLNLACDLVEPFRPLVDYLVYQHQDDKFDQLARVRLTDLLNLVVTYNGKKYDTLSNCLIAYVTDVLNALCNKDAFRIKLEVNHEDYEAISHV